MNLKPCVLALLAFPLATASPSWSQDKPAEKPAKAPAEAKPKKELPDFIRYKETDQGAHLETAIKTYKSADGVTIDMVGVVHIADKAYYEKINHLLEGYNTVLFELVGSPEDLKNPNAKEAPNPLRGIQKMAGSLLKLEFQLENINYDRPNFIHADVSAEEFAKLQGEKGETLFSLLGRAMRMEREGKLGVDEKPKDIGLPELMSALSGGNAADGLKIMMAKIFDQAETMMDNFEGEDGTVILTERNKVVSAKLKESVKSGKKKLAIFYGAGHLPGLEEMILKDGYKQEKETWLAAWTMKKPAPKKAPAVKPEPGPAR